MENKVFKTLVILAIAIIILTAIGKYYEVQKYKKSIENLELEHEILIKKKKMLENEKKDI
ncbi:hypothetical protein ACIRNY_10980 [Capnocytophaga canimorsus]|uniref:hypothetical protein n=1 Tax=Capnocytophaga canimorsus TaxID=28188 RepID=UPI00384D5DD5